MKHRLALAALAALFTAPLAFAQQPSHLGRWIVESGNLEIEIAPCADALCGKVVRVIANRAMGGPGHAAPPNAPSPLGLVILSDLKADDDGQLKGRIYNRESDKHYSATVKMGAPDQLLVHGYVGLPVFGKTQVWHRPGQPDIKP